MGVFNKEKLVIFRISTLFWTVGILVEIYWCFWGVGVLEGKWWRDERENWLRKGWFFRGGTVVF